MDWISCRQLPEYAHEIWGERFTFVTVLMPDGSVHEGMWNETAWWVDGKKSSPTHWKPRPRKFSEAVSDYIASYCFFGVLLARAIAERLRGR